MNILKSRYPELHSIVGQCCPVDMTNKDLFRTIYLTNKFSRNQIQQWQDLLARSRTMPLMDMSSFLFHLFLQCYAKNRSNILLVNIDSTINIKFMQTTCQYELCLTRNALVAHLCRSARWLERRRILSDDAVIYLLAETNLIECLSRKRQLYVQLSGIHETFYSLPYYQTRTNVQRQQADQYLTKYNRRQRTVQFHLQATRQGQQAHLTELYHVLIARHLMLYHVSKFERYDVHHAIETSSNGVMLVDAMRQSTFSQVFFNHRPKDEVVSVRLLCLFVFTI
jgi:hypothetical protein